MRFGRLIFALFAGIVATLAPAVAAERTFAVTYVRAGVPAPHAGYDAGIDVTAGGFVRLSASGTIAAGAFGACPGGSGPDGCGVAAGLARQTTGALMAAFATRGGLVVSGWVPVGQAAYLAVPPGAATLVLRIEGTSGREFGAYRVVADLVPSDPTARSVAGVRAASSARRPLPTMRSAGTALASRSDAQHLLRRFGFSAAPADVTAVYRSGTAAWVQAQINPSAIDDSASAALIEPIPLAGTGPQTNNGYDDYRTILERRILQREITSKRQLLEKMTVHWLEHFAVSEDKVNSAPAMIHYEETVRTDALGNFKQLVADVAVEPAMLLWLDNNNNDGSNPAASPPNENFGRELMQLYVFGTNALNADGSNVLDGTGNPVPLYSEDDVKQVSLALTGFQRTEPYPIPLADPRTIDGTKFYPTRHAKGPFTILGRSLPDTGDPTIVPAVVGVLAGASSTAPFQVKELLQRFATQTPSPGYISRIVSVWNANAAAPDQLARVMTAIAADPEFGTTKGTLSKEPVEFTIDAIRALGGSTATPFTSTMNKPYNSVRGALTAMQQPLWYPPSVFSFYRPGEKESLLTNALLLARWNEGAALAGAARTATLCATCDVNLDLTALVPAGSTGDAAATAAYLTDALVDGGTPELTAIVQNYLANNVKANVPGAVWLLLTSPEYEAN